MGKDEITVTNIRLAKEIISNDTVIIGTSVPPHPPKKTRPREFSHLFLWFNCLFVSK